MGSTAPSWPSLYDPGLEILHVDNRPPTQPGAAYLYNASDIFRFTLYWTLVFYMPIFFLCGFYAFCNYTFPPSRSSFYPSSSTVTSDYEEEQGPTTNLNVTNSGAYIPLQTVNSPRSPIISRTTTRRSTAQTPRKNERRSRVAFALLVLLVFLVLGMAGAVVGSAVLGFTMMGLYRAANFNMSTWIPFLLAVIQVLVGLLSIWPSIIEII